MTPDQASACKDCVQLPWALGATLASYNLEGAPAKLKLSGPVLAEHLPRQGHALERPGDRQAQPRREAPATTITPVYRSDGSGDTYAFSDYLAKVSPEWKSKLGVSTQVNFPKGIGGRGSDGVAAVIGRTNGAIGYLGKSYVLANKLDYALIRNEAGKYPVPGAATITAAADAVKTIPPDNAISITNPPASAPDAYPISTFTYVLFPTTSGRRRRCATSSPTRSGPARSSGRSCSSRRCPRRWSRPTRRRWPSSVEPRNHLDPSL